MVAVYNNDREGPL